MHAVNPSVISLIRLKESKVNTRLLIALIAAVSMSLMACSVVDEPDPGPGDTETGTLNLNIDIIGETDVVGFAFEAERVYCPWEAGIAGDRYMPAEVYTAQESLEELYLPGGNPRYVNNIYDGQSQHHFSDTLMNVSVGCYDITATPLQDQSGSLVASDDCSVARLKGFHAEIDVANEVQLFSQCEGLARTTLDILASLNHPPRVDIDIQKFTCAGGGVRVCATASDPDNDPIRFDWEQLTGNGLAAVPEAPESYDPATGETTQCAMIPTDPAAGSHDYRVTARDYGWDNGVFRPIEDIITDRQVDPVESSASMTFSVHGLDDCIPAAMTFFGFTFGADLSNLTPYTPDPTNGMTYAQAKQLAENAINWVNPNLLGDPDPRILIVLDNNNTGEDTLDAPYIEKLLEDAGFTQVDRVLEPAGGLMAADLVGYKVVWMVNPGFPPDSDNSHDALRNHRENGGGLVVSGDDMSQSQELTAPRNQNAFTFLDYLGDNGVSACGQNTNNWTGKKYDVKFPAASDHPLVFGLIGQSFPYGNDLDAVAPKNKGETILGGTTGLTMAGKENCLQSPRPVITAVPEGVLVD